MHYLTVKRSVMSASLQETETGQPEKPNKIKPRFRKRRYKRRCRQQQRINIKENKT